MAEAGSPDWGGEGSDGEVATLAREERVALLLELVRQALEMLRGDPPLDPDRDRDHDESDGVAPALVIDLDALGGGLRSVRERRDAVSGSDLEAIHAALGELREQIAPLSTATETSIAIDRAAADAQALTLARVTAAADGLSASVGALRAAMGRAIATASDTTVAALAHGIDERLRATEASMQRALDEGLRHLDLQPLHARLDALDALVRSSEADGALLREGPVASHLARLSATIASQARVPPVWSAELDKLSTALAEARTGTQEQLDRQTELTEWMAARLASLPSAADQRGVLHAALGRSHDETTDALAAIGSELAEMRAILERRSARRRRGLHDDASALALGALHQDLAETLQRELDEMRGHLRTLADGVERAALAAGKAIRLAETALLAAEPGASPGRPLQPSTTTAVAQPAPSAPVTPAGDPPPSRSQKVRATKTKAPTTTAGAAKASATKTTPAKRTTPRSKAGSPDK